MKFYGSLQNRLEEGKQFVNQIEVGTGITEYLWSDTHAYEVTKVINQNNFYARKYDRKLIGGCYSNEWQLISNENNPEFEVVKRNNIWYKVTRHSKEHFLKIAYEMRENFGNEEVAYKYFLCMSGLTPKQKEKIEAGKEVKQYTKFNISIGKAQEYFDYEF